MGYKFVKTKMKFERSGKFPQTNLEKNVALNLKN